MNERYRRSTELLHRAREVIPLGSQTFSKSFVQYPAGAAPLFLERGRGARVWDVDGNEYVDFVMGLLSVSLGYGDPDVTAAVQAQLESGVRFSLPHPLETEVAEAIVRLVPCAAQVRFAKNGSDVTTAAVRLARAFTGRNKVLSCGYHGWHDWYIAVTDRNKGIPGQVQELSYTFNYNDAPGLEDSIDDDTACVILEPMVFEAPKDDFLQKVRNLCTRRGVVLVFDEMWTGFRFALGQVGLVEPAGQRRRRRPRCQNRRGGLPGSADMLRAQCAAKRRHGNRRERRAPQIAFRIGQTPARLRSRFPFQQVAPAVPEARQRSHDCIDIQHRLIRQQRHVQQCSQCVKP